MSEPLRIAVASGKGGTGKTTIATNLAAALARAGARVAYVDCDVEEPNGHIFLAPELRSRHDVTIPVPEVNETRCTLCGNCGAACRYSAIVVLPKKVLTFPNLCHGCGGCSLACTEGAIREVPRVTGVVEEGISGPLTFLQGRLHVGDAMAPPVIRAVLRAAPSDATLVIDSPPGTSCPVIESVKTATVVLLVTEPTPFGLHDLGLAVEMVRDIGKPFAVAINRAGAGDRRVLEYCAAEQIPVLLELPQDREIARAYARGRLAIDVIPALQPTFLRLADELTTLASSRPGPRVRPVETIPAPQRALELRPATLHVGPPKQVPELVVVSGKGGTGKTSITASFFALAGHSAVADCDVDAADLHLVLQPEVRQRWPFAGGLTAVIDQQACTACGLCAAHCRYDAIRSHDAGSIASFEVDSISCEGCGVCADICPERAVELVHSLGGESFVSSTRHGPMAHARLGIAQENSGKLVSLVRREAKAVAAGEDRDLLLCDGSPGIGCPVIASITGARMVLVVTEPTLSGLHDLARVAQLTRQFGIKTAVCVNKADIDAELSARIQREASELGIQFLGMVRYDDAVSRAQVEGKAVVELGASAAGDDIRALWSLVERELG